MDKFVNETFTLLNSSNHWREKVDIAKMNLNIVQYYEKYIKHALEYRVNEDIILREFEAWVLLSVWWHYYIKYNSKNEQLINTIRNFCSSLKKIYPYSWRILIMFYPNIRLINKLLTF